MSIGCKVGSYPHTKVVIFSFAPEIADHFKLGSRYVCEQRNEREWLIQPSDKDGPELRRKKGRQPFSLTFGWGRFPTHANFGSTAAEAEVQEDGVVVRMKGEPEPVGDRMPGPFKTRNVGRRVGSRNGPYRTIEPIDPMERARHDLLRLAHQAVREAKADGKEQQPWWTNRDHLLRVLDEIARIEGETNYRLQLDRVTGRWVWTDTIRREEDK